MAIYLSDATPLPCQMLVDINHPDPQPWERRGRHSPRSAVNLTGQYGKEADEKRKKAEAEAQAEATAPAPIAKGAASKL